MPSRVSPIKVHFTCRQNRISSRL